jgi:hypothetical protein
MKMLNRGHVGRARLRNSTAPPRRIDLASSSLRPRVVLVPSSGRRSMVIARGTITTQIAASGSRLDQIAIRAARRRPGPRHRVATTAV